MGYEPLEADLSRLEQRLLEQWRAEDLFHRSLAATAGGKPFVFYEGPPTANGRPGIHHVFARTIKDLICRYHTMRGESVTRIAGWDTHGLPVEIEVEKQLKISGKSDIEAYGVAEFNERCKENVFQYKSDWESLSERIGYWLDYDRPYITYTKDYVETVWWLLKRLAEKGLLYEGHKVLPYCGRCGTALSSHEVALGYDTHRSPSIYVLFRLKERNDTSRFLLVWTTTPWTLPSNVAIAVNSGFRYVELDIDGRHVIVEKSIAERTVVPGVGGGQPLAQFSQVADFPGSELVGAEYEQLIDAVSIDAGERAFRVAAADFVTSEEGTGLVHIAPAFGADDYAVVEREGMAYVNPVDETGAFAGTSLEEINGVGVFDANGIIAERLQEDGKLFGKYQPKGYEHTYPFCWRCDSPLIYYARKSWFVRTTAFKDRMIQINQCVQWHPREVGVGRFGEWLENNVDWALSRDRFWGTPLPVWICDRDDTHRVVIGSYAELARFRGRPLPDDFDPHKPYIDSLEFACTECSGTMNRVPEVIDAWFDSGSMPYAQWHYPHAQNREEFERHFPADFICEGLDQTRGWFYSLLAIAAGVFEQPAYRNVIVNGLVLDPDGRKMSKRLGNVVSPFDVVEEFGADAVRLYLIASSQVWLPKKFDQKAIPDVSLGFLHQLRNTYGFFSLYAEEWEPRDAMSLQEPPAVDQWLLSRLDRLVDTVHEAWSGYDVTGGIRAIMEFCDVDLSNWYVRVNRSRFWAPDASADPCALTTLYEALTTVSRLLAPAAPFLSDAIHRQLHGESVHLAKFPESRGRHLERLDRAMDAVRTLASLARRAREDGGIRVRQPLACLKVALPAAVRGAEFDSLLDILAAEVNVREVLIAESDVDLVSLRAKPNFRTLGKVYGKDTPEAARAAQLLEPGQLRDLEAGKGQEVVVDGRTFRYEPDDVVIERDVVTDWLVQSEGPYVAALDPKVSLELEREGLAREMVNRIQRLRKQAGYDYDTRIAVSVRGSDGVLAAIDDFGTFIAHETLARQVEVDSEWPDADVCESVEIDDLVAVISLRKYLEGNDNPKASKDDGNGA
ncbi:MAG: isoleucine--tRNA ligase [Gemmatimonadales bacterium]